MTGSTLQLCFFFSFVCSDELTSNEIRVMDVAHYERKVEKQSPRNKKKNNIIQYYNICIAFGHHQTS